MEIIIEKEPKKKYPWEIREIYMMTVPPHEICAAADSNKNHCPNKPVHFIDYEDDIIGLCESCFQLYQKGWFDKKKRKMR